MKAGESYLLTATPIRTEDVDWTEVAEARLDPRFLECVEYMRSVESHTAWFLRAALSASPLTSPEITEFLIGWAFEETHHGHALARLLAAQGRPVSSDEDRALRSSVHRRDRRQRRFFSLAQTFHLDLLPIHMVIGALNEWTAQGAYLLLASKTDSSAIRTLLKRMAAQEARHAAFYAGQARALLADSSAQRRFVRLCVTHSWHPVGGDIDLGGRLYTLHSYLYSDEAGAQALGRLDARAATVPGLEGLTPVASFLASKQWTRSTPATSGRARPDRFPPPTPHRARERSGARA